ncbi:transposase [Aureimonas pseudogalii]|uniref:Transposase n=1 Tax=Aureimonas pseudogalii TaxID=1744844 RepID=A0A7W6E8K1_9HYPH|nr:transposase [Aureimonas pseudogalii]MBB3996730.1 transposase [Aureimonas pseudogalii]
MAEIVRCRSRRPCRSDPRSRRLAHDAEARRARQRHPLFLPPRAPEPNPVESVWQFLRDNWLSHRVFTDDDDIVAHCCEAWNKLVEPPWKIILIGMRDRAHRS